VAVRVLHISPVVFRADRELPELRRLFGEQDVEVQTLNPLDLSPAQLVDRVREARPDAVLTGPMSRDQREALRGIARETPVLSGLRREASRPERYRGEQYARPETRWAGFGRWDEHGEPQLLPDRALAREPEQSLPREETVEELMERQQREREDREPE
jgi:hypothetical protein